MKTVIVVASLVCMSGIAFLVGQSGKRVEVVEVPAPKVEAPVKEAPKQQPVRYAKAPVKAPVKEEVKEVAKAPVKEAPKARPRMGRAAGEEVAKAPPVFQYVPNIGILKGSHEDIDKTERQRQEREWEAQQKMKK